MTELPDSMIAMREKNIGRLFQRAARVYSERALALLHERGFFDITLSHTALIANLNTEGDKITVLAEKAGITKQAMGQLVNDLEKKGYVEKTKTANDKRAYLVQFTERGESALHAAYEVKVLIEEEYKNLLGMKDVKKLRSLLELLIQDSA